MAKTFLYRKHTSVLIFIVTLGFAVGGVATDPIFGQQRTSTEEIAIEKEKDKLAKETRDRELCESKNEAMSKTMTEIKQGCTKLGYTVYADCQEFLEECSFSTDTPVGSGVSALGISVLPAANHLNKCSDIEKGEKTDKLKDIKGDLEQVAKDIEIANEDFKKAQKDAKETSQKIIEEQNQLEKDHNAEIAKLKKDGQEITQTKLKNENQIAENIMAYNEKISELFAAKSQAITEKSSKLVALSPGFLRSVCENQAIVDAKTMVNSGAISKGATFIKKKQIQDGYYKELFAKCYNQKIIERDAIVKHTNQLVTRIDSQISDYEQRISNSKKDLAQQRQIATEEKNAADTAKNIEQSTYLNNKINLFNRIQQNQKELQDAQNKHNMDLVKHMAKQNELSQEQALLKNMKAGNGNVEKTNAAYGAYVVARKAFCNKCKDRDPAYTVQCTGSVDKPLEDLENSD